MIDYASLVSAARNLLFVDHIVAASENLNAKARFWYNALWGNLWPSMDEFYQHLDMYSGPRHMDGVTTEAALKGLVELLATLCSESHPLVLDLIPLLCHNYRERYTCIDWETDYYMIPMYFLRILSLDINTWCISVEEEVGYIDSPSRYTISFDMDQRNLDWTHVPAPEKLLPGTPSTSRNTSIQNPRPAHLSTPTAPHTPQGGRSLWKPPTDLLLIP